MKPITRAEALEFGDRLMDERAETLNQESAAPEWAHRLAKTSNRIDWPKVVAFLIAIWLLVTVVLGIRVEIDTAITALGGR